MYRRLGASKLLVLGAGNLAIARVPGPNSPAWKYQCTTGYNGTVHAFAVPGTYYLGSTAVVEVGTYAVGASTCAKFYP